MKTGKCKIASGVRTLNCGAQDRLKLGPRSSRGVHSAPFLRAGSDGAGEKCWRGRRRRFSVDRRLTYNSK
eukprot:15459611-Alexandrium_andersonii.AAC.1